MGEWVCKLSKKGERRRDFVNFRRNSLILMEKIYERKIMAIIDDLGISTGNKTIPYCEYSRG